MDQPYCQYIKEFKHLSQREIRELPWDIKNYLEYERSGTLLKNRENPARYDREEVVEVNGKRIKRLPLLVVTGRESDPRSRLETSKERQALLRYEKTRHPEWMNADKNRRRQIEEELKRKRQADPCLHENRCWVKNPLYKRTHFFNAKCKFKGQEKHVVWREDRIEDVMGEPIYTVEKQGLRKERQEAQRRALAMLSRGNLDRIPSEIRSVLEEEHEKQKEQKQKSPQEIEKEKQADLRYKHWQEHNKKEFDHICKQYLRVNGQNKEYDENNPRNPNPMNLAMTNAGLGFYGKGELVIMAQRERMRFRQCQKLRIPIKAEYKEVNHFATFQPKEAFCAAFTAPYLVRDDSEKRPDSELSEFIEAYDREQPEVLQYISTNRMQIEEINQNGPWRLFHAWRIRNNGLLETDILEELTGPDFTSERYSEDLEECSLFVKYYILLHYIKHHCVPSFKQGEWIIPTKQELKEGIKKAIEQKVFASILQLDNCQPAIDFYSRALGINAPFISQQEQMTIDATISDYFQKAQLVSQYFGTRASKIPLDKKDRDKLVHKGINFQQMGFQAALNQASSQARKSNLSAQLQEGKELIEQKEMEQSKYMEEPPLIQSQMDVPPEDQQEQKFDRFQENPSGLKIPLDKSSKIGKGIKESDLEGIGQKNLEFNKEYNYDPTKYGLEEAKNSGVSNLLNEESGRPLHIVKQTDRLQRQKNQMLNSESRKAQEIQDTILDKQKQKLKEALNKSISPALSKSQIVSPDEKDKSNSSDLFDIENAMDAYFTSLAEAGTKWETYYPLLEEGLYGQEEHKASEIILKSFKEGNKVKNKALEQLFYTQNDLSENKITEVLKNQAMTGYDTSTLQAKFKASCYPKKNQRKIDGKVYNTYKKFKDEIRDQELKHDAFYMAEDQGKLKLIHYREAQDDFFSEDSGEEFFEELQEPRKFLKHLKKKNHGRQHILGQVQRNSTFEEILLQVGGLHLLNQLMGKSLTPAEQDQPITIYQVLDLSLPQSSFTQNIPNVFKLASSEERDRILTEQRELQEKVLGKAMAQRALFVFDLVQLYYFYIELAEKGQEYLSEKVRERFLRTLPPSSEAFQIMLLKYMTFWNLDQLVQTNAENDEKVFGSVHIEDSNSKGYDIILDGQKMRTKKKLDFTNSSSSQEQSLLSKKLESEKQKRDSTISQNLSKEDIFSSKKQPEEKDAISVKGAGASPIYEQTSLKNSPSDHKTQSEHNTPCQHNTPSQQKSPSQQKTPSVQLSQHSEKLQSSLPKQKYPSPDFSDRRVSKVHRESEFKPLLENKPEEKKKEEQKKEEEKKQKHSKRKANIPYVNTELEKQIFEPFTQENHSQLLDRFSSEDLLDQENYTQRESHEEQKALLRQKREEDEDEEANYRPISSEYSVDEVQDKKALKELKRQKKERKALPLVDPKQAQKILDLNKVNILENETGFLYIYKNATKVQEDNSSENGDESTQSTWRGRLRDRNAYKMPLLPHDRYLYVNGEVVGVHRGRPYADDMKRVPDNIDVSRREAMKLGRRRTREEMESNERYIPLPKQDFPTHKLAQQRDRTIFKQRVNAYVQNEEAKLRDLTNPRQRQSSLQKQNLSLLSQYQLSDLMANYISSLKRKNTQNSFIPTSYEQQVNFLVSHVDIKAKKNLHQGAKLKAALTIEFRQANVKAPVTVEVFEKEKGKIVNKRVKKLGEGVVRVLKDEYFKICNGSNRQVEVSLAIKKNDL